MSLQSNEVVRQSLRYAPTSNTEVNVERLPDSKSLQTMELRFRALPQGRKGIESKLLMWLLIGAVLGSPYASLWLALPEFWTRCVLELQRVDGLAGVASMLGGMLFLIGVLSLVFVPRGIRIGLAMLSLPIVFGALASWKGREREAAVLLLLSTAGAALSWRFSLRDFHEGWLLADSRVDKAKASAWNSINRFGWAFPSLSDVRELLARYLSYDAPPSGAAGVWAAPSSLAARITLVAMLAGSIFIIAAIGTDMLAGGHGSNAPGELCGSIALLILVVGAVMGEITFMTKRFEHLLGGSVGSWWQQNVDRLSVSDHVSTDVIGGSPICEAEHLFLGAEPWQNFPILLHLPMLYEHVHIVGRTGSGKTSMGLMQLLIQVIRGHNRPEKQCWSDKTPMVIVDLKGDAVLFQTAKAEAEERGQKFRFFTLEPGKATHLFNPFSGFRSLTRSVTQLVHLVLGSLSLFHGRGYGKGYYSERSRFLLSEALRVSAGVNSFQDLYRRLKHLYQNQKQDFQDAFELLSVIESLTHYPQLVTTQAQDIDNDADVIRMERVLEDREVVYFWLPSAKESATVAEIGKLVLFNLQTAAQDREAEGKKNRQAFLVIDECQKLAGENFQQILQQARSAGIAVVLANQSLGDLKTEDWDLGPTIRTNTRVKMYFSMNEPEDLKMIGEFSGEEIHVYGAEDTESIRPRMSAKELLALSDHPKRLLLHVSSGSGYTQFGGLPVPVETDWPISKSLADKRAGMPWPALPMPIKAAWPPPPEPAAPAPPAPRPKKPKPAKPQAAGGGTAKLARPVATPTSKAKHAQIKSMTDDD